MAENEEVKKGDHKHYDKELRAGKLFGSMSRQVADRAGIEG